MGGLVSVPREHDEGRADRVCRAHCSGRARPIAGARQHRIGMAHDILRVHVEQPASVTPTAGITCLWQVSGRNDIDFHGQVRLDVQYIERQTLTMDISILLRTVPAALSGKGAS